MKAKTNLRAGISCTPNATTTGAYSGGSTAGSSPRPPGTPAAPSTEPPPRVERPGAPETT